MSTHPPPSPDGVARAIEEAIERIQAELRQAIAYVNDAIVPQVRRESVSAMRATAEALSGFADRIERQGPAHKDPPSP